MRFLFLSLLEVYVKSQTMSRPESVTKQGGNGRTGYGEPGGLYEAVVDLLLFNYVKGR